MPTSQDKSFHLLFRAISRGTDDPAADLISRLVQIKDAKTDLLTDDEYAAWREIVLKQIVARVRVALLWQIILGLGCVGALLSVVYGIVAGSSAPVGGA